MEDHEYITRFWDGLCDEIHKLAGLGLTVDEIVAAVNSDVVDEPYVNAVLAAAA